jgi:hypothetical protein
MAVSYCSSPHSFLYFVGCPLSLNKIYKSRDPDQSLATWYNCTRYQVVEIEILDKTVTRVQLYSQYLVQCTIQSYSTGSSPHLYISVQVPGTPVHWRSPVSSIDFPFFACPSTVEPVPTKSFLYLTSSLFITVSKEVFHKLDHGARNQC